MLTQCLAGIRVLDLGQYLPGPFATQWLSDLGAEVVKIEPPAGDPLRTMGPLDADGTTFFYKLCNRNKTVIRLDLKSDQGRATLDQLFASADVLVEGFRPGALARLGFAPDEVRQRHPRLIHCALSGYGQTGPHALAAGHDLTYMALSGFLPGNGPAERPVMAFPPLADHAGAMLAVVAVLAALIRRGRTGSGAFLDVSLSEAALSWMGGVMTAAKRFGPPERETGMIDGGAAFYRIYPTQGGGYVVLAAIENKFWQAFCEAVGRPDWTARQSEPMPQKALIADLEALFATRTRDDWAALLIPADCCFAPVLDPTEVPDAPQTQARGFVQADPGLVDVLLPMMLDGTKAAPRRPIVESDATSVIAAWQRG